MKRLRKHGVDRLLVSALSCVGFAWAAGAQLVRVPHTSVLLSPPPGFAATRNFSGLENRSAGWMIRVQEFDPSEEHRLADAFSSPERANVLFGPEGIRITDIERFALESGNVPLAIGVQKVLFGRELVKYMALLGAPGEVPVVLMFNLNRSSALGRRDVEAVLRSVKTDRPTTLAELRATLPFSFREAPPFHTAMVGSGAVRLMAFDHDVDPSKWLKLQIFWRPTETRASETAQSNGDRARAFSRDALIVQQRAVAFAGGPGDFITALAGGRTTFLFLRVLPNRSEVGLSAEGESRTMEAAREAVMDIARSVELRETALGPVDIR